MVFVTVLVALCSLLVSGKVLPRQVHESRVAAPEGFISSGPAAPDTLLSLRIALVQNNIDGISEIRSGIYLMTAIVN